MRNVILFPTPRESFGSHKKFQGSGGFSRGPFGGASPSNTPIRQEGFSLPIQNLRIILLLFFQADFSR